MLDVWQALALGALQGITELFPISSLGHTVLLPSLIGWDVKQSDPAFLSFLVATHFATALVLLGFYAGEWMGIVRGMLVSLRDREITTTDARVGWLLVVATVPAGLLGLLFEDQVRALFASARIAATFLIVNGVALFGAELLRRRAVGAATPAPSELSWKTAVAIGTAQASALLPGLSRTGATMSGGLIAGLSHADAAHFAFLMATPIILAAAVLKLPETFVHGSAGTIGPTIVGMIASGIAAFLSVRYLTRYFRVNTLTPFALYCLVAGCASLAVLLSR